MHFRLKVDNALNQIKVDSWKIRAKTGKANLR